jgi:hypothetical protein
MMADENVVYHNGRPIVGLAISAVAGALGMTGLAIGSGRAPEGPSRR